ncbi:hypothetical protein [Pedobacter sp. ASV28]|uniref:hypothetical protein n=1 Tax=Pedobacter sp. ASV28 TaxID=2795123 RepID=UPI0018EBA385|nr:hypothetical protein [Pedobacter sp. ASV28]
MIREITWTQYVFTISGLCLCYYLYLFYRFAKKSQRKDFNEQNGIEEYDPSMEEVDAIITDELFEKADELIQKLTVSIEIEDNKEQLCALLSGNLGEYPELNTPAFRAGINNRIQTELEKRGVVTMSEHEVDGLW